MALLACIAFAAAPVSSRPLIVGSEQDYPPFALGLTDATADGFTVDLWKAVARDAGIDYRIRVRPFHELLEEFRQGKIDVLINLAQSDERHKFADFTVPHVVVHAAIFVRGKQSDIHHEADLKGKSVVVVQSDIAHEYAVSRGLTDNLIPVPTAADGLKLLASGKHDAMLVSKLVGLQTLEQLKLSGIAALPIISGATQKFSFAVKKGNADLLATLNEGLSLSRSSGEYARLYQKWFGIYEPKEPELWDLLKYLLPLVAVFAVYVVVTHFLRLAERQKAMQQLAESHHMLQTVVDSVPMNLFWKDRDSRYLGSNTTFAKDAGMSRADDLVGKLDTDCAWREFAALYREDDRRVMESGQAKLAYEEPYTTPEGKVRWVRTSKTPLRALDGAVMGVLGILYDITQAKEVEDALKKSQSQLQSLFDNMINGFALHEIVRDENGKAIDYRFIEVNGAFERMTGLRKSDILGKTAKQVLPRLEDYWLEHYAQVVDTGEPKYIENYSKDIGRWFSSYAYRPAPEQFAVMVEDITEVKRAQEQMLLASMVYENSSEAMMITDADGRIIAINPAFTKTTGYTFDEVRGKNPRILKSGRHDQAFYQAMWEAINSKGIWQGEVWDRRKNGEEYPKWTTINTTFNADGSPYRRVALFSDISEKKKSEQLIWQQANFDTLTGLPNRRMFHVQLEQEIKKAHRHGSRLAVLFIDLDRFKEVNDTLGHEKGDLLLVEAARRLVGCVRESDTVARLGGDEFTIILSDLQEAWGIDRIVKCILDSLVAPFALNEEVAYISASIGITLYPEDATNIDDLLRNADQAMYSAKHQGRNRYSYFTQSMDLAATTRMRISNDLRVALQEKQFWVAYQPIVELATGNIHKAEALLRWQHPTRGVVSPAEFIPVAEETGLIMEIGNWVFLEAARQVCLWRSTLDRDFQVSINKSPVQFQNDDGESSNWVERIREMDLPGEGIVVEITEGLLLHADKRVDQKLVGFREKGIEVAIDDFGTGYSALAYLKKFDIDYLKIDRAFVSNLGSSAEDLALCEAIIVMAHKLGIRVIAEGVETREQLNLLKAAGCDYAQGYYFSRPVDVEAFERYFRENKSISDHPS